MNKTIPLFPLSLVVFPNSQYPLHIFEPRYKRMLDWCLLNNKGFGIVAKFGTRVSDVGVYVIVTDVLKKYQGGESDIVVKGVSRFLVENTKMHSDGYLLADVDSYEDLETEVDDDLANELVKLFKMILEKAKYSLEPAFWQRFEEQRIKSFKLAEKSGLTLEQQQELLILKDENERINYLIDYFEKLYDKFDETTMLKQVIMNNGYLNLK